MTHWCSRIAGHAACAENARVAHELMLLLYSSALWAASAVRAACEGRGVLGRSPFLSILRACMALDWHLNGLQNGVCAESRPWLARLEQGTSIKLLIW